MLKPRYFLGLVYLVTVVAVSTPPSLSEAAGGRSPRCESLFKASRPLYKHKLVKKHHFITAPSGRVVSYEIVQGLPGHPVYVTFNGLIYRQAWWDKIVKELNRDGATIIRYNYSTDPLSLRKKSKGQPPAFSLDGMVGEVDAVLAHAGYSNVTLLTLSFGSIGIEYARQRPENVERVVLMAPMVVPSDHYDLRGTATRSYLQNIRDMWGEQSYELQWTLMMEPTVRSILTNHVTLVPDYVPAGVTPAEAVNGAIEKVKASRDFDLRKYADQRLPRVDLLLAGHEDGAVFRDQMEFWKNLPEGLAGNFVFLHKASHALPGSAPVGTARILKVLETKDGSTNNPFIHVETDIDGTIIKDAGF